ncbi:hypothetical protein PIB30_025746 [Stylosanthes scabra]|uniref:Uncharacterized protein n=1 Tax=Stylosanthes scabra TaxID=79078 RepID=A0ABU6RAF5_9FABA|nr:hypothetical protein [Stylosanthes scabra]
MRVRGEQVIREPSVAAITAAGAARSRHRCRSSPAAIAALAAAVELKRGRCCGFGSVMFAGKLLLPSSFGVTFSPSYLLSFCWENSGSNQNHSGSTKIFSHNLCN